MPPVENVMHKQLFIIMSVLWSLTCACAIAQEDDKETGQSVEKPSVDETRTVGEQALKPVMSPAQNSPAVSSTANELITQSSNTIMTSGTCLVVDDLVKQFCNANPDDISCQFQ